MKKNNVLLIFLLIFCVTFFSACNPGNQNQDYYYRAVRQNDVILTQKQSGLRTFEFYVRPQENIENLYIEFAFFDSQSQPVIGAGKHIGDVNKGGEYTLEITFDELSLSQISKIKTYKKWYSQGRIKIDQDTSGICFKHKFGEGSIIKNQTCGEPGEKMLTCKNCKYIKTEIVAMDEHDFIPWQFNSQWEICTKCAIRQKA
ncbi:MAG: hypothetical protein IKA90_00480 [Clostridia bacterium]|nr:hypothetical protein [Clostridia bacterium]